MAGPTAPNVSTANSFSERAPMRAPATSSTGPSAGRPSCARASARGRGRAFAGNGRPTTVYFGGRCPGSGKARKTRRAKGAASRFAKPRWASASVSAAGIRRRAAASTIGPATKLPAPSTTPGRRRARIRSQAAGAASARNVARACAIPGCRGTPLTRKVSSSYPASGTSRASARSGEPANVTRAPRARSASATASAGSTWPAVPPAAIRHAGASCSRIARDVKEDPDRGEPDDEARPAVRDEGQRDPGQRREAHDRLQRLVAGALRVLPRIDEAEEAGAPVRLEPDREQADSAGDRSARAE